MSTPATGVQEWPDIDWPRAEKDVRNLQGRIYRASQQVFMPEDRLEVHHDKRDGKRTGQLAALHRHCHDTVHGSGEAGNLAASVPDKD